MIFGCCAEGLRFPFRASGSQNTQNKRRRGDSNPRIVFTITGLAIRRIRPLCHLSGCGDFSPALCYFGSDVAKI